MSAGAERRLTSRGLAPLAGAALACLVSGVTCGGGAPATPAGLRIDLILNGMTVDTVKISVSASPGGFAMTPGSTVPGVTLSNETDASGAPALVLKFSAPYMFTPTVSFRLDTENKANLTMTASALAFNGGALVAGAVSSAAVTLPAGGNATLPLSLETKTGLISPDTTTTDLAGDAANVAVLGAQPGGGGLPPMASLAVCDLDGDNAGDFVIGAPNVDGPASSTAAGAVYVVFADPAWGTSSAATIDLANPGTNPPLVFYGHDIGDHLGTSIACADVDGDGLGDIVVGAPGADNGGGRVYLLHGRRSIHSSTFDLTTADAQWLSMAVAPAGLGAGLYVADLDGNGHADILAAASGAAKVHLFSNVTDAATPRDVEVADHVTFSGVVPTALGGGDLNDDGKPDIVLGDSEHRPAGAADKTGAVYVFAGVDPNGAAQLAVDAAAPGSAQSQTIVGPPKSQFGAAVLAVDTAGSGTDLVVGAPSDASAAGSVFLFQHDTDFFVASTRDASTVPPVKKGPVASGRFGCALGTSISGTASNPSADLVVGALGTPRGARLNAGAAYFFKGGPSRSFPLVRQLYGAKDGDQLGTVVAGGQINADKVGDFAALAPNAAGTGANTAAGVVYGLITPTP